MVINGNQVVVPHNAQRYWSETFQGHCFTLLLKDDINYRGHGITCQNMNLSWTPSMISLNLKADTLRAFIWYLMCIFCSIKVVSKERATFTLKHISYDETRQGHLQVIYHLRTRRDKQDIKSVSKKMKPILGPIRHFFAVWPVLLLLTVKNILLLIQIKLK